MSQDKFHPESFAPGQDPQDGYAEASSRTAPPSPIPGYELQSFLGRGAYGEVWSARDQKTGRSVAIKFYSSKTSEDIQLLAREVEKLVVLAADRYVVQLLDVGWDASPPYYVMDYIERGSLEEKLVHGQVVSSVEATDLFTELATGMMHLHGKGILHCDLKPGNVLLDRDGKPRLADFGQARLQSEATASLGTLFYMAPEQADTQAVPDQRWDVYGLGALFYSMLTGKPPYYHQALAESLQASDGIQDRLLKYRQALESAKQPVAHRRVEGVDWSLAEIIDRCIAVDPDKRFNSIQDVLFALRQRELAKTRRPLLVLGFLAPMVLLAVVGCFSWYAYQQAKKETESAVVNKAVESNLFAAKLAARSVAEKVDDYYRAVMGLARSPEFMVDFERLVNDSDFKELRQKLANPNTNSDATLDPLRRDFLSGYSIRNQVDRHLQERMDNLFGQWPEAASWVVYDRQGNQLAARFSASETANTIGKNYSYRSYFTGRERDLVVRGEAGEEFFDVSESPDNRTIINRPHMSAIFLSQATQNWKITFSAPVRIDGEVAGVVGCSVEMGDFIDFEDGKGQYAMLVDSRPGDNTGVVLEHPLFDQLREGGEELPNSLTRLRVENVASYGASAILFTDPIADDVEGREFQGLWIAAAEPVTRLSERAMETDFHSNAPERDVSSPPNRIATGLYVLAAEDYSSVIRPVRELTRQLTWLGWGAIGFFLIVALGMWLFVMRLLAESRERLGRAYSMSVDSSLIVTGGGIDGDIVDDPFRTVGQSASDAAPD